MDIGSQTADLFPPQDVTCKLKEIRVSRGLTQAELGELAGLSQAVIASLERLRSPNPKWDTVCRLSYALNARPEDLFGVSLPFRQPLVHRELRKPRTGEANGGEL